MKQINQRNKDRMASTYSNEVRTQQLKANEKTIKAINKLGEAHNDNVLKMVKHYQPSLLHPGSDPKAAKFTLESETLGEALRKSFDYYLDTVKERDYPYTLCFDSDTPSNDNVVFIGKKTSGL